MPVSFSFFYSIYQSLSSLPLPLSLPPSSQTMWKERGIREVRRGSGWGYYSTSEATSAVTCEPASLYLLSRRRRSTRPPAPHRWGADSLKVSLSFSLSSFPWRPFLFPSRRWGCVWWLWRCPATGSTVHLPINHMQGSVTPITHITGCRSEKRSGACTITAASSMQLPHLWGELKRC